MTPFHFDSGMKNLLGTFYPTGWLFLMFPGDRQARDAAKLLEDKGIAGDGIMLVTPDDFRREILDTKGDDVILPSAGTEGDTVRKFNECFEKGHHGLLVHAPKAEESDRVMELLQGIDISYGQKYRKLVIEDVAD